MSFAVLALFTACSSDDDNTDFEGSTINNPATYSFERNGESTISYDGQTTRIKMGQELLGEFNDNTNTFDKLNAMFAHVEGALDFEDSNLNDSNKNLRSKVAASADYFSLNATDQALIRTDLDGFIDAQVNEVYPNWNISAEAGVAGQLADGERTRYVSAKGLEYNQLFAKSLIGSLMADQMLNNYLSSAVLDGGENRANNEALILEEGKSYTTMEHLWDEAYGYAYGLNADPANPNADLGADSFLNEYIERANADPDFAGIADEIFQAFKLGRAAIVAKNYKVRDGQAEIVRKRISEVIAIRAIFYLQAGKVTLESPTPNYGSAFHALSEAYGFIYSLQFTRKPNSNAPYFSKAEVDALLVDLMDDGANGLWDINANTLNTISMEIADRFEFTLEQAAE